MKTAEAVPMVVMWAVNLKGVTADFVVFAGIYHAGANLLKYTISNNQLG